MPFFVPTVASANQSSPCHTLGFTVYADAPQPLRLSLTGAGQVRVIDVQLENPLAIGARTLCTKRVAIPDLPPDTVYSAVLCANGREVDRCLARTWPTALGSDNAPFEILLGSCYSTFTRSPGGNDLGQLAKHLSRNRLPHLKLLCGDQVYQDIPVRDILPAAGPKLEAYLLDKYLANWSPSRLLPQHSFGDFLRCGSNLFVTDDHEYWNNYPYFLSYGPHLWAGDFRERYTRTAQQLVDLFQLVPPTLRTFTVGTAPSLLSVAVLDGRRERSEKTNRAHTQADLRKLATFLGGAPGPAVVVLSQPLFQESVGWLQRTFVDRGFADLEDGGELVDAIAGCPHDVLVLSGDIHGGSVASARRSAAAGRREQMIVEVIASPLSLVEPGRYLPELPTFAYPEPREGQKSGPYSRLSHHFGPVQKNHAALIKLWSAGGSVRCAVDYVATQDAKSLGGPPSTFSLG